MPIVTIVSGLAISSLSFLGVSVVIMAAKAIRALRHDMQHDRKIARLAH